MKKLADLLRYHKCVCTKGSIGMITHKLDSGSATTFLDWSEGEPFSPHQEIGSPLRIYFDLNENKETHQSSGCFLQEEK